jgi:hypothetical protein
MKCLNTVEPPAAGRRCRLAMVENRFATFVVRREKKVMARRERGQQQQQQQQKQAISKKNDDDDNVITLSLLSGDVAVRVEPGTGLLYTGGGEERQQQEVDERKHSFNQKKCF